METIMLWNTTAPYSEKSPDQAQPSLAAYPVKGSRGAVVVVPGGGYAMKADHEGGPIAEMLNRSGISAYVLDYRVCPCDKNAPLSDASRAIRVVRAMCYEKVAILGFSAGGHLTCSAATLYTDGDPDAEDPVERLSSRPDAFVPCYAVASFSAYRHQGSLECLLGKEKDDYELQRHFSAELNVTKNTPPAFLWHTANDACVPVENSLMLAAALSKARVPFELHIYPDGEHGLGLATGRSGVENWSKELSRWLLDMGYGA